MDSHKRAQGKKINAFIIVLLSKSNILAKIYTNALNDGASVCVCMCTIVSIEMVYLVFRVRTYQIYR